MASAISKNQVSDPGPSWPSCLWKCPWARHSRNPEKKLMRAIAVTDIYTEILLKVALPFNQ